MPVISMFYDLIMSMYYLDTKQHALPHIHLNMAKGKLFIKYPMAPFRRLHPQKQRKTGFNMD